MTRDKAFALASKRSKERHEPMYVVCDPSSDQGGGPWQVATEFDLDTMYLGCTNITEVVD